MSETTFSLAGLKKIVEESLGSFSSRMMHRRNKLERSTEE